MLPIPQLDDEGFRQIMEQAKGMIPRFSATWTDFNHHDPGITLLELFAFLKETQQYHLDQIGPRNCQKFLKLLGETPATSKGAKVWCNLRGGSHILPRGTRLLAGAVPFELESTTRLSPVEILGGKVETNQGVAPFQIPQVERDTKLHLLPFGKEGGQGSVCYLQLSQRPSTALNLHFRLGQETDVPRNPLSNQSVFTDLVTLEWCHSTPQGWAPLTVVADQTHGLLFDGQVTFALATSWAEEPWIRCTIASGDYDVPPVVVGISTQMAVAVQEKTTATLRDSMGACDHILYETGKVDVFSRREDGLYYLGESQQGDVLVCAYEESFQLDRILAVGTGFPRQTFHLPAKGLVAEKFQIMVQAVESEGFAQWQQVADFDTSTPEDTHYVLDCEKGILTFGDCHHGLAPEGEIRVVSMVETLGIGGNIQGGALENLGGITVYNPDNASGGQNQESQEMCLSRCRKALQEIHRAVTYDDYETLVYGTPGLRIANCMAVPVTKLARPDGTLPENWVTMVVEPYGQGNTPTFSPQYRANILQYLEPRRMLGTKVEIVPPTYISISIFGEILVKPHYMDAKARITAAVEDYFLQSRRFGVTVQYSGLYGKLDTLDCVSTVETLTIDAQGRGISRSLTGDVILPYHGLAVLQSTSFQIRSAQ